MRKRIDFWKKIYAIHESDIGIIHDGKHLDKVYEIVNLSASGKSRSLLLAERKRYWRKLLVALHQKNGAPDPENADESHAARLFQSEEDPSKFLNASHRKRLRSQTGHKGAFLNGLKQSGRWLPLLEAEFRKQGLPLELARLPFVESSFNLNARSQVGASGIWQLMREAGSHFLKIGHGVDERNDPVRAARAAALHLKQNHESLGHWPLAVTAYNHGRQSLMRAVRQVGSHDIEDIIERYKSRTFGFSSSNFLSCLIAAVEVENEAQAHFGTFDRATPTPSREALLPASISLQHLARALGLPRDTLTALNPAWDEGIARGSSRIPAGYMLRLPESQGSKNGDGAGDFEEKWTLIPKKWLFPAPRI